MWSGKGLDAGELRVLAPVRMLDYGGRGVRRTRVKEAIGLRKNGGIKGMGVRVKNLNNGECQKLDSCVR